MQVTTEFVNNFPQVVRILFDQSPCLLRAWRFWLWHFFASVLFARLAHDQRLCPQADINLTGAN
jgi:hypothetical protein